MNWSERLRQKIFANSYGEEPAKPSKGSFAGFDGSLSKDFPKIHKEEPPPCDKGKVAQQYNLQESDEGSRHVGESRSADSVCEDSGDKPVGIKRSTTDNVLCESTTGMDQGNQTPQPGDSGILAVGVDMQDLPSGPLSLSRAETRERHKEILARVKQGDTVYMYSHTLGEQVCWVRDEQTARSLKRSPDYQGEVCYTLAELRELSGQSPELLWDIHQFKRAFDATLQKTTKEDH